MDLYDGVDPLEAHGVGAFDIMAYPYGQNDDADTPGHLSIWSKVLAEWATPSVITQSGEFTLQASEVSDEAFKIYLSEPNDKKAEYLLIENRQPLGFDINIWSSGLAIYHIDDAARLQKKLGYPGQPGWPENDNHYQVAVLAKDGQYDLEKGNNVGDAGDLWEPGDVLGRSMGGSIYPNTDRYQRGNIKETGIMLEVLRQDGTNVTFQVQGLESWQQISTSTQAATPTPAGLAQVSIAPTPSNLKPGETIAPTFQNLGQFDQNGGQPMDSSYLSQFGSHMDTSTSLQNDREDAKGFIDKAIELLSQLGITNHARDDDSTEDPAEPSYVPFHNSKKETADGSNPLEDVPLGGSTTSFFDTKKEKASERNPGEDSNTLGDPGVILATENRPNREYPYSSAPKSRRDPFRALLVPLFLVSTCSLLLQLDS